MTLSRFALAAMLATTPLVCEDANADGLAVSAGQIREVCVTPTVTTGNAYGTNYVVGGLLAFPAIFPASAGGAVQIYVQVKKVESMGFTFTPLSGPTTATTWTDAQAASINVADVNLQRGAITLTGSSVLGTATTASGGGPLLPVAVAQASPYGPATLYGVLTTNAVLTNNFTTTGDLTVCADVLQFP